MEEKTQVVKKAEVPMVELVLNRVNELESNGGLTVAPDFNVPNALRSAYLILQDMRDSANLPVLQSCTPASIQSALFKMCVDGLNPSKHQCSFIVRGGKLNLQREYAGSITLAKRYGGMKDVFAGVIYEGDVFEWEIDTTTGMKKITRHDQRFENLDDSKIKGGYAVVVFNDGSVNTEIMTLAQVKKSWEQGPTKGQSPAHKNFPGEMVKKTVINRACKLLIASSDDSVLNEPGEDGRVPRRFDSPEPTGQVIDIPDEPQIAQEVVEPEPQPEPTKTKRGKANEQTEAPF